MAGIGLDRGSAGRSRGHRLRRRRPHHRQVLVFDPPRTLEHEWHFEGETTSVVRYDLLPVGEGTRLTFTHRDLGAPFATGYPAGWHAYLDRLGALLDGTEVPDWDARLEIVRDAYR